MTYSGKARAELAYPAPEDGFSGNPLRLRGYACSPVLFMVLLFCIVLSYPWPGLPGSGMTRTGNMLVWAVTGAGAIWPSVLLSRRRRPAKTTGLLAVGLLLLTLPALWTPRIFWPEPLYRFAGTAALALLLWLLLPLPVRGGARRAAYAVIVIAALIQAFLGIWEAMLPDSAAKWLGYNILRAGGRATGTFGQANLMGSFLATGLLCATWLMLSAPARLWRWLAGTALVPLCIALTLSESRSAWLGGAIGVLVMFCVTTRSRRLQVTGIFTAALLAALATQQLRPPVSVSAPAADSGAEPHNTMTASERLATDRAASGQERRALAGGAIHLIAAHPLAGNGIGSFERAFPIALARTGHINPFPVTVTHPHNEILYVWSEGGLAGLAGLFCWLALWLLPFRPLARRLLRYRNDVSPHVVARGALTIPLMVHVMTEYPFYLSAAHGVLMVLLLWLALPAADRRTARRVPVPALSAAGGRIVLVALCLGGVLFMVTGLQSALRIQTAEHARLTDPALLAGVMNPLAQPVRLRFDLAQENLIRFSTSGDARWLDRFQQQAGDWLERHNDANFTDLMMRIAQARRDNALAGYWRQRGCMSFHADPRFRCDPAAFTVWRDNSRE